MARSVLGKFGQEHRKAFPRETTPDFGSERGEEFLVTKSERAQRQWRQIIEQVDADDDIVISFGHVGGDRVKGGGGCLGEKGERVGGNGAIGIIGE